MDPFETVELGDTGVHVTRLGLGGVFVSRSGRGDGSGTAYEIALDTIRRAYEVGIRYFDTAPLYGQGRSESRYGKVLGQIPRTSFVLSTKVGRLLEQDPERAGTWKEDDIPHFVAHFDLSRDGIRRSVEESLQRMGLESIEILYLHDPDEEDMEADALASAFPAMQELKEQGIVKAIGTGMNQWEMPARFLEQVDLDVVLLAGRYTLLDHAAFPDFLPLCLRTGTKVVTGGPYNSGILAATDLEGPVQFNYRPAPPEWTERTRSLNAVCDRHGVDLRAAALQFPLAHPAVASVIPGAATPDEVVQNAELVRVSTPTKMWDEMKSAGLIPKEAPVPD